MTDSVRLKLTVDFETRENAKSRVIVLRKNAPENLVKAAETGFATVVKTPVEGGRGENFKFADGGRAYFVKVMRHGGAASFLGDKMFSSKRLQDEIHATETAIKRGIRVPAIQAGILEAGVVGWSITIVYDALEAKTALALAKEGRLGAFRKLAREIRRLHEAGIYHSDLNLNNMMIRGDEVWFVDLDKCAITESFSRDLAFGNLARLNRHCEKWIPGKVTDRMKLRFVLAYLGGRDYFKELKNKCETHTRIHSAFYRKPRDSKK